MGASLGETGPFACSCLPFPGPQRPIKGSLMEDDKRQPTPLLSVCASPSQSVYPPKVAHFFFFFFFLFGQAFLNFFPPSRSWCCGLSRVKGWSRQHSWERTLRAAKDQPEHVCYGLPLAVAKWRYLDTKPPLSFRFISRVLKATECNSVDGFRCTHLSHSATSNFKGVDRKQNMYYEGDCHQWIIGCQLEKQKEEKEKKKTPRMQHIEKQSQPLLCSLELNRRLSRQVRGRNLKSYFPCSHSLTRMHDKTSCQQGQE